MYILRGSYAKTFPSSQFVVVKIYICICKCVCEYETQTFLIFKKCIYVFKNGLALPESVKIMFLMFLGQHKYLIIIIMHTVTLTRVAV